MHNPCIHIYVFFEYVYVYIYIDCWFVLFLSAEEGPQQHMYIYSSLLQWLALLDHVLYVYRQVLTVWNGWTWRPLGKGSRMVSWIILDPSTLIILDPSTFYAYHCAHGFMDIIDIIIIYSYIFADYVDLICMLVSGSDCCEFI